MSEDPMADVREQPRPEFAASLWRRLGEIDRQEGYRVLPGRPRLAPALLAATAVMAVALAFTLAPVRAVARGFLELFRVKRFAAVVVDPARLAQLQEGKLDLKTLVGEQVEVTEPAREPEIVAGVEEAEGQAGISVEVAKVLPERTSLAEVRVGSPGHFRVHLDVLKLQSIAQTLGVEDVAIPAAWDGATVEVAGSPVVALRYHRDDDDFMLLQSKSPVVDLPEGVALEALGTFGLRLAGMSAEEAGMFARQIDWRSTLLVPIPAEGGTFREVDVNGVKGLLVTTVRRPKPGADGSTGRGRRHSVLLWSAGPKVYALAGPGDGLIVLEIAQSVG